MRILKSKNSQKNLMVYFNVMEKPRTKQITKAVIGKITKIIK